MPRGRRENEDDVAPQDNPDEDNQDGGGVDSKDEEVNRTDQLAAKVDSLETSMVEMKSEIQALISELRSARQAGPPSTPRPTMPRGSTATKKAPRDLSKTKITCKKLNSLAVQNEVEYDIARFALICGYPSDYFFIDNLKAIAARRKEKIMDGR